jgi:hypothetical protein
MMKLFRGIANLLKKDTDLLGRILLIIGIAAALVFAIILSGPKPKYEQTITPTPIPTITGTITGTNTVEFPFDRPVSEYAQTTGVAVGVSTVVVILLIGIVLGLIRDRKERLSGK